VKYKFYHILALFPEQAEAELNQFCAQHHVLKTEREFVADSSNSFWSVCVMYSNNSDAVTGIHLNDQIVILFCLRASKKQGHRHVSRVSGYRPEACRMADFI